MALGKVLIVDGNKIHRKTMSNELEQSGIETTCIETVKDAVEELKNDRFDSIITELIIGKDPGAAIIDNLKKFPKNKLTPVIIISEFLNSDVTKKYTNVVSDIIDKPLVPGILVPTLTRTVKENKFRIRDIVVKKMNEKKISDGRFPPVLIVNRNKALRDQIITKLRANQHATQATNTIEEAIALLEPNKVKFSAIVLDAYMNSESNSEFLKVSEKIIKLRKVIREEFLPIIFICKKGESDYFKESMPEVFTEYVIRPEDYPETSIPYADLISTVEKMLKVRKHGLSL